MGKLTVPSIHFEKDQNIISNLFPLFRLFHSIFFSTQGRLAKEMEDSTLLSFSEEAAKLGPEPLRSCPALSHAVYQLACRGGPFSELVASSVTFRSSTSLGTSEVTDILSNVATKWAIASASEEFTPQWKVVARGEALLPDELDRVTTVADWVGVASNSFSEIRRKMTKALVQNQVSTTESINKNLRHVLRSGGLVDGRDQLTGGGLRFCLSHPYRQAWHLTVACFRAMEDHNVSKQGSLEMAAVLFQLDPTSAYKFPVHHQGMRNMLGLLASAGLVFLLQKDGQKLFLVSPHFALGMATSGEVIGAAAANSAASEGTIIIETNFRLYLYGKEDLLLEVVLQFASLDVVVSDALTCCRITRASFMDAAQRGIRADQVIEFLELKAHPVMRKDAAASGLGSVVPQSVCDQLRMWEAERNRVSAVNDCVVISGATDVVLKNLAALGLAPIAVSRTAVAVSETDYEKMNACLH